MEIYKIYIKGKMTGQKVALTQLLINVNCEIGLFGRQKKLMLLVH